MREPQSKEEFLAELRRHLKRLPQEEIDEAVSYYAEYFEDAGPENLYQTLRELGSPREVALQIQRERAMQHVENSPPSAKKGAAAVWFVILGVFATPIALPIAIAIFVVMLAVVIVVFAVLFSLCVAVFSVVIAFGAVTIACLIAGIAYICMSIPVFFQHIFTGLYMFGLGLAAAGIGVLAGLGTALLAKIVWRGARVLFGRGIPKLFGFLLPRRSAV